MNPMIRISLIVLATGAAACGSRGSQPGVESETDTTASAAPAPPASGMQGMQGMGGMQSDSMPQMDSHMQAMRGATGDSLMAMLPMHRQMAANMLSQMNGQMRQMNMQSDPAWIATADSLRQDLVRMADMSAAELHAFMPQHAERMQRLMTMHRSMMSGSGSK